jgi:serine/threonine-protein kinase
MPGVAKPCAGIFRFVREEEDTQAFRAVDTERHEVVREEPAAPPPAGPPPGAWWGDVWPWLALLALLAVAGLLAWFFLLRDDSGPKKTVPAVVGLQQQVAIHRLTSAGYSVRAILGPATRPLGIVVAQAPGGGSQLPKGSQVTLHVSNGHKLVRPATTTSATTTARTTTAAAPTVQVPAVMGQEMAAAAGQVEAAGFVAQTDPAGGGGLAGTVVGVDPAPGTQAPAGGTVLLSIATGTDRPAVQIPDVRGKSAADARAALLSAGLTVRTAYAKGKPGVVLSQSATGSAPKYTQIAISVGK